MSWTIVTVDYLLADRYAPVGQNIMIHRHEKNNTAPRKFAKMRNRS